MTLLKDIRNEGWKGLIIVTAISTLATLVSTMAFFASLGISSLIIGILLGVIFGNSLRKHVPLAWTPGIHFAAKKILRLAIILYGFRITFQQIAQVGLEGFIIDVVMLSTTFLLGSYLGIKILKIDRETTFMTASGASICGAAAVLATEPVVKAESHKTSIAVATVVLFGTISMFLYPVLYKLGMFAMDFNQMGIYIGATVHEVAHVVAAGNAISPETSDTAVIVKMTRVMLLVPTLLLLSYYLTRKEKVDPGERKNIMIPWFAVGFIAVAGFNSFHLLSSSLVSNINVFDTFLLTMAMTALGIETNASKFKISGGKPVLLAFILFLWLILGGYFFTQLTGIFWSHI
jgi:uncharacterized integral membrane protein (TIGR00698 family)